ncbi:hypothetical protein PO124_12750 [Bacillus licheniformis]|nr:hypothetical protein [Bacillus licheniformis]
MTYDFNGGWQSISAHNAPLFYDPKRKKQAFQTLRPTILKHCETLQGSRCQG